MANPGEELDMRGNPCKATGGAYNILTLEQNQRIHAIGRRVIEHHDKLKPAMAFDPHKAVDDSKIPYWGSRRHVIESALKLLERKIDEILLREK
jgi:hypothetical protein